MSDESVWSNSDRACLRANKEREGGGRNVILYIALFAFLIWAVYNGDVSQRAGSLLAAIFIVLNLVFFLMKLPLPWYLVTFVAATIYLIVKTYGGDVKIR